MRHHGQGVGERSGTDSAARWRSPRLRCWRARACGRSTVQAAGPDASTGVVRQVPTGRSEAIGVTAGAVAYLIGGYDGTALNPAVLATRDWRHFRVAARLPVLVRYAAAAVSPGGIWVFGGQAASGATDVIQRIDPAVGTAVVAGHLPRPLQGVPPDSLTDTHAATTGEP
jgi:hypothetical protein